MSSTSIDTSSTTTKSTRLVSLDVFRGFTIAFMILVNNNGDQSHAYSQLKHADWNGWTATDLVFPTFLFLLGVSIVFAFESRLSRGTSKKTIFLSALRRAIVLFLIGLVINGFPYFHLSSLRIYGVLQRIALCFLIAAALYLWTRRLSIKIAIVVVALLGYWILLRWVPVPGFGFPGVNALLFDPRANLTAYVDRCVLPGRLYNGFRDPEGLVSTMPALATTLLGVLTGIWLRSKRSASQKNIWMMIAGVVAIGLGLIWNQWFPINKNLWTSSYVLFAGGCSLVGLAICYWAIEIKEWKRGWTDFWLVFGTNAITVYVISELLNPVLNIIRVHDGKLTLQRYIFLKVFAPIHNLPIASLLYAICFMLVCFLPGAILYRKRIFLKV